VQKEGKDTVEESGIENRVNIIGAREQSTREGRYFQLEKESAGERERERESEQGEDIPF